MTTQQDKLIEDLIKDGFLQSPRVIEAFRKIDRSNFVIEYLKNDAYINSPLAIGFGQTISQPLTVAFMLEKLDVQPGHKVLDVGSGSGWTTALLAEIVGEKGKVYGIEIIPEIYEFGKANVMRYSFINKGIVEMYCGNGLEGLEEAAPFDRIMCSAAVKEIPQAFKEQLKIGGKMILPMNHSLWLITKKSENEFDSEEYPGFIFVPVIDKISNL
ncbi:MAG TPA: protein-L-isoaspartate O-methyltransferase [Candidatus Paceibacterota bacterium]|nr:protein-L-isoaspartate O-methyltransferase [Candidatus Paceibacterota bacterium]HOV88631.1 protein-L-isoaspartate O-methyltransferase [Candidatus Paceibacterota bacterium]HRU33473.1 protein-L-isoaspartate O-methyltransferase [Candidatus Paceibacterota bacterium]